MMIPHGNGVYRFFFWMEFFVDTSWERDKSGLELELDRIHGRTGSRDTIGYFR